jgi:integrase
MDRLKLAVPDLPLSQIGYDQIRQIINHFTSRPVSPVTGRKIAPDTVIDTLAFTRALFVRLADQHKWASPMSIDKVFKYNRQKLYTDAELERKAQVQVFTLDELKTLWMGCGKCLYELLFLLGLNCGFTAMEIATLRRAQCHLDGPKPFIRRIRHKTQVKGVWRLWPETADLLRQLMCGENEGDLALRTKTGKPLVHYFGRSRNDAVGHAWDDVRKRVDGILEIREMLGNNVVPVRKLGFKYLRKTGSNLIRRIGGKDCAEVYLAHADKTLSRVYNNRDFKSLSKAIRTMRRQLVPVLGPEASEEEPAQAATVSPA